MKYGVIDVGGGLRGIYGAGVLDRCLEEDLRFDLCIGVSAGSANMASYLAGQHGRNKPFYDEYSFRREYMSVHNLIRKHSYLDLGYVYGTLSNAGGENPLDYAALARSPAELCVVAANAQNGEAQYFTKADLHPDDYRVLMASCCIPVIDQPCVIDGVPYFDGGLADARPESLARPGHVFPLAARSGGVLERGGHTEGSVDLTKLAGLPPCAVLCELTNEDGTMARLPEVVAFACEHDFPIVSIDDIRRYRTEREAARTDL